MATAAPAMPNIMQGKKPAIYMPTLQLMVVPSTTSPITRPAQKWVRSPMPTVSNQNTLFNAWCRPVGMSKRFRKV